MGVRNLILLTNDPQTSAAVAAALQSNGKLSENNVCRDLDQLGHRLDTGSHPAALVDLDPNPQVMLQQLEALIRRRPEVKFLVVSNELRSDLMLEAMQIGARHFMLKQSIANELTAALRRICPNGDSEAIGRAVTVLSASGGCGATTVAVNLAAELKIAAGQKSGTPALIVDLDHAYGAVGSYLGINAEYGAMDLLGRPGPIDSQLIISTAQEYSDQIHALLSTSVGRLGDAVHLDAHRLALVADACRKTYSWTVFDAPRLAVPAAAELAKRSSAILVLLQMTVKDLRIARRLLDGLAEHGIARSEVKLIANRYRKRGTMIRIEEARQALGLLENEELSTLANDFVATTEAVNFGKPLCHAAPRSDFRRDIQRLATGIVAGGRRQGGIRSQSSSGLETALSSEQP